MSPQDNRGVHPYLRRRFYTTLDFWENSRYTEKAKRYYRSKVLEEQHDLDRLKKSDSVIWSLPR